MFGDDMVEYEYQKWDPDNLVSEKLTCNGRVLIDYEYFSDAKEHQFIDTSLKKSLNISLVDNKLSVKNTFTGTHQRIMNRLLQSLSSSVKTRYGIAGFQKEAIMQGL